MHVVICYCSMRSFTQSRTLLLLSRAVLHSVSFVCAKLLLDRSASAQMAVLEERSDCGTERNTWSRPPHSAKTARIARSSNTISFAKGKTWVGPVSRRSPARLHATTHKKISTTQREHSLSTGNARTVRFLVRCSRKMRWGGGAGARFRDI